MQATLKLFVSSTFEDFRIERAILQKYVFKKVKKELSKKGIGFIPVDLRWGVPEEAQLDQRTMEICLNEVKRSTSEPHPDFLMLVGDRYGWIPLPYKIEKDEFEKLLDYLKDLKEDISLLKEWYYLDYNQLPLSYMLKRREGKYTKWENWQKVENKIRELLQKASTILNKKDKQKYFKSATDEEFDTILKLADDTKNRVFTYVRNFKDSFSNENLQKKFIDTNPLKEKINSISIPQENKKEIDISSKFYENLYSNNIQYPEEFFENIDTYKDFLNHKDIPQPLKDFAEHIKNNLLKSVKHYNPIKLSEQEKQERYKNYNTITNS